jgi:hypothetical protein
MKKFIGFLLAVFLIVSLVGCYAGNNGVVPGVSPYNTSTNNRNTVTTPNTYGYNNNTTNQQSGMTGNNNNTTNRNAGVNGNTSNANKQNNTNTGTGTR